MAFLTCGDLHMEVTGAGAPAPAPAPAPDLPLHLHVNITKISVKPVITEVNETVRCPIPVSPVSPVSPLSSVSSSAPSSPKMETPRMKGISPPRSSKSPDSPIQSPPRAASRTSSTAHSLHHSRSASRSTARSQPPSRRSSFHSSRKAAAIPSIVPVPPARTTPQERRESLLNLHRESCRLFQDPELSTAGAFDDVQSAPSLTRVVSSAYKSRSKDRGFTETKILTPPSPIASSSSSRCFGSEHRRSVSSVARTSSLRRRERSNTLPVGTSPNHVPSPSASSIHVPSTVMEWTSASTRRQEYEKIDRASRGVRGFWRRVAPRWCQARDSRLLFFEEGKPGCDGSVRRFRMDLPDEEEESAMRDKPHIRFLDTLHQSSDNNPRRLWLGRRSRTCP